MDSLSKINDLVDNFTTEVMAEFNPGTSLPGSALVEHALRSALTDVVINHINRSARERRNPRVLS